MLFRKGLLDSKQLEQARAAQTEGHVLIRPPSSLDSSRKKRPCGPWPVEVGLEFVDLVDAEIDLSLLKDFPSRFVHRQALFPIRRNNGSLIVATSDPFNLYPLDELSVATGLTVVPVLAAATRLPS